MRHLGSAIGVAVGVLGMMGAANGERVQWRVEDGGNGHWYEAVPRPDGITWVEAQSEAEAVGGYLVTISSGEENQFVFDLVQGDPVFWDPIDLNPGNGPWLGGFQPEGSPEPDGNWQWVTGGPFDFTSWSGGEPGDYCGEWGGAPEDALGFHHNGAPVWNDVPGGAHLSGYILEVLPGDVATDGDVDLSDQAALLGAYGYCTGDPQYNAGADFNGDGCVDLVDLAGLLGNYGFGT